MKKRALGSSFFASSCKFVFRVKRSDLEVMLQPFSRMFVGVIDH